MPKRRSLLLAAPLLLLATGSVDAADEVAEAEAFVRKTGDSILAVVNGSQPPASRQAALAHIVDSAVDVDGVARFALGHFWRLATPEQRSTYLSLFRQYLVFNVTGRLNQYKGTTFTIDRAQPMNDAVSVSTTIHMPRNPPADMQWIVSFDSGGPKIIDLIAEGTSLRITQRSDYASVITRNGGENVQPLLDAMRQQISKLESSRGG